MASPDAPVRDGQSQCWPLVAAPQGRQCGGAADLAHPMTALQGLPDRRALPTGVPQRVAGLHRAGPAGG
eukprot:5849514-Pyramimonas_sp.AAC.1